MPLEYVHVIDKKTRKSIHVVGPTARAEKVEGGMSINLDHEKFETAITSKKEWDDDAG